MRLFESRALDGSRNTVAKAKDKLQKVVQNLASNSKINKAKKGVSARRACNCETVDNALDRQWLLLKRRKSFVVLSLVVFFFVLSLRAGGNLKMPQGCPACSRFCCRHTPFVRPKQNRSNDRETKEGERAAAAAAPSLGTSYPRA